MSEDYRDWQASDWPEHYRDWQAAQVEAEVARRGLPPLHPSAGAGVAQGPHGVTLPLEVPGFEIPPRTQRFSYWGVQEVEPGTAGPLVSFTVPEQWDAIIETVTFQTWMWTQDFEYELFIGNAPQFGRLAPGGTPATTSIIATDPQPFNLLAEGGMLVELQVIRGIGNVIRDTTVDVAAAGRIAGKFFPRRPR